MTMHFIRIMYTSKGSCRSWKKIVKVWMKEKLDVSFGQQLLGLHVFGSKIFKMQVKTSKFKSKCSLPSSKYLLKLIKCS